jgi:hypothetical protein
MNYQKKCECGDVAVYQCSYTAEDGRSNACLKPLCDRCAVIVDHHTYDRVCHFHARVWGLFPGGTR